VATLIKLVLPVAFLSFLLQTCKDPPKIAPQKAIIKLDFTYIFPVKAIFYSLKLTTGDTAYIKDDLTSQTDTSFYAIITKQDRLRIDSLINTLNLLALDTSYVSNDFDGDGYNLSISKNDTLKAINIHRGYEPEALRRLSDYLIELKTKLKLFPLDKNN